MLSDWFLPWALCWVLGTGFWGLGPKNYEL